MQTSRIRRPGIVLAFAILTGCSAGRAPALRTASGPCAGQPFVEVRNYLPVSVDVYGYSGSTRVYLGSASPGVERLPVFHSVGYIYADWDGRRVSSRRGPSRVTFTRVCER